jgi:hypothetical protein
MIKGKDFYNLISRDSMSWLDNSEKLKFSSEVIYKELQSQIELFLLDNLNYESEDKILALWDSYYLLIGQSFENLIKALSIENNRSAKSIDEIYKKWKYNSGHEISKIAQDNISNLSEGDSKILEKLETYIIWAGRYHLPRNVDKYINEESRLYFDSKDIKTINVLYAKIRDILLDTYDKNEKNKRLLTRTIK